MGYTTRFKGKLRLSRKLTPEEIKVIHDLNTTRHGGNLISHPGCPSFYCGWTVSPDGRHVTWDGSENFYEYVPWLDFIIDRHLERWGVTASGTLYWSGDSTEDRGRIRVENSVTALLRGHRNKKEKREKESETRDRKEILYAYQPTPLRHGGRGNQDNGTVTQTVRVHA